MGYEAMEALIERFPGDVAVGFSSSYAPLRPVSECGALLKALAGFGRDAIPAITPLLLHGDNETRFYAVYLLSELVFPEAIVLLAARLQDDDRSVRWIAAQVLKRFSTFDHYETVMSDTFTLLGSPDAMVRRKACEALGNLGDAGVAKALLNLLGDPDPEVKSTAHEALVALTKEDLGEEQDDWMPWLEQHLGQHRIQWLVDGLIHDDLRIRSTAAVDLADITGMTFGYDPELPVEQREVVHEKFLHWWETSGIHEFK